MVRLYKDNDMTDFDIFTQEYGQPANSTKPDSEILVEYGKLLPAPMLEFWETYGFSSYGDGLIWVLNPRQLEDVLRDWYPAKAKRSRVIPVIRTAFGKLIYWHKDTFSLLDVHANDEFDCGDDVELLFTYMLVSKKGKEGILQEPLFKKVSKKLGALQVDEMYSYKLALSMGGDYSLKNVEKMKMREQLSILSQLHTSS